MRCVYTHLLVAQRLGFPVCQLTLASAVVDSRTAATCLMPLVRGSLQSAAIGAVAGPDPAVPPQKPYEVPARIYAVPKRALVLELRGVAVALSTPHVSKLVHASTLCVNR